MENQQEIYVTLSEFWPLRAWGGGWLSESVKKREIHERNIFSDNVEWSSKKL